MPVSGKSYIGIIGAGALGRELHAWMGTPTRVMFLDDVVPTGSKVDGRHVVRGLRDVGGAEFYVAVANPRDRERLTIELGVQGFEPHTFRGWNTMAAPGSTVGGGCLLFPHSLISTGAVVGRCCVLNAYASIGHDCDVGDFCTLSAYVGLAGRVKVGRRVTFGIGAKVIPGVSIGEDAEIGAGAIVIRDVLPGGKVFGNPGRLHE